MIRKNIAGQHIPFLLIATDGTALTGATVTARLTKDEFGQALATGTTTEDGYGQYNFNLSQADTNANQFGLLLSAPSAVPVHFTVITTAADPTNGTSFGLANLDTNIGSRSAPGIVQTTDGYGILTNGTYGNAALQALLSTVNGIVTNGTYGNAAIETITAAIQTQVNKLSFDGYGNVKSVKNANDVNGTQLSVAEQQNIADALKLAPASGTPASGSVMDELNYTSRSIISSTGLIVWVDKTIASSGDGLTLTTAKKTIAEGCAVFTGGQKGVINVVAHIGNGYNENVVVPDNVTIQGYGGNVDLNGVGVADIPLMALGSQSQVIHFRFLVFQSNPHLTDIITMLDNSVVDSCSGFNVHATSVDRFISLQPIRNGFTIRNNTFGGSGIKTAIGHLDGASVGLIDNNIFNSFMENVIDVSEGGYVEIFQNTCLNVQSGYYGLKVLKNSGVSATENAHSGPGGMAIEIDGGGAEPNVIINNDIWPTQQYIRDAATLSPTLVPMLGSLDGYMEDVQTQVDQLHFDGFGNVKSVKNANDGYGTLFSLTERQQVRDAMTLAPTLTLVTGSIDGYLDDLSFKTNNRQVWEYTGGAYTGKVFIRNSWDTGNYAYTYARNPITLAVITDPTYRGPINFDAWTLI